MKEVPLTNGGVALVDDEDYEQLSGFSWYRCDIGKNSYAARTKSTVFMHTFLMKFKECDHKDGDGLNNQRSNLRFATRSQNNANSRKRKSPRGTSSIFKGVYWDSWSSKWRAQLVFEGKVVRLGRFSSEKVAAEAYDTAAVQYYGEFAKTNSQLGLL